MKWANVFLAIVLLTLWLMPSPVSADDPLGFLFPFLKPPGSNYTIAGNSVYIDNNDVYISASPHTLAGSGWVEVKFMSKLYSGPIDLVYGFDGLDNVKAIKTQTYESYEHTLYRKVETVKTASFNPPNIKVNDIKRSNLYNSVTDSSINLYKTYIEYEVVDVITKMPVKVSSVIAYDSFDGSAFIYKYKSNDEVAYKSTYADWSNMPNQLQTEIVDYKGSKNWQRVGMGKSVIANTLYITRVWIDVPYNNGKLVKGKYNIGIKPLGSNITDAWLLDPWYAYGTYLNTGGTITTDGLYTVHTFTSNGTFTCGYAGNAEILVVAGGGSGGTWTADGNYGGGGGGGGGLIYETVHAITANSYTVTVGDGGTHNPSSPYATQGGSSTFDTHTATGGGGGVSGVNNGGSGAGAFGGGSAGTGIVGQGNNGGSKTTGYGGAGGGGAGGVGANEGAGKEGGNGGSGLQYSISGSNLYYAAGGGGGGGYGTAGGTGGSGIGGNGGTGGGGTNGTDGRGGGGGGGAGAGHAGDGGDGVVIIRCLTSAFQGESGAVTLSASSVEETTATITGNITLTGATLRGFAWGTTSNSTLPINEVPPASYSNNYTEQGTYGIGTFSYNMNSLTSADKYYFRAYTGNSTGYGWGGEESFFTKPNEPTGFTCTSNDTAVDLSWTKATAGTGATMRTYIRYKAGSYPADQTDGTLSYNGTDSSYVQMGLVNGTTYYFRGWSWANEGGLDKYSDSYGQCNSTPAAVLSITTSAATSVEETTATANGNITNLNGGANATVRGFQYDIDSGAPYAQDIHEHGSFGVGAYSLGLTGLTSGEKYYHRAYATNPTGTGYGSEVTFLTKPDQPIGLSCTSNSTAVDLTWTNATVGAGTTVRTVVRYKTGGYPANTADGTLSYNGTGTSHVQTGLTDGTPYYFRAWTWAQDGTLDKYSDDYSSCTATPSTPVVTTGICTGFLETWAIVHGSFESVGVIATATQVGFDYGLTSAYGLSKVSSGTYAEGDFQLTLTSLNKATLYHYRAKALVNGGWYYGIDRVFATKGSPAEYEYHNTGGDSVGYLTYSGNWTYQTFTTNMTNIPHSVTSVKAKMKRVGSPGDVTMSIKNTSNCTDIPDCYCDPTGADIVSDTLDGDTFSTDFVWYEFTFDTEKCLSANTTYALVLRANDGTNANYVMWERDNVGTYAGGNAGISLNSGVNWIPTCAYDHLFEIWGNPCLSIEQGKVFTTYLEEDDWLITCLYKNTFPPYYDNAEDISSLFYLQLVTTDGATVIAQTRVFDWGYRPGAIYLNADAVDPLEWGDEYYLRMYGNFGDYPYAEYQLQDADWMGDDLARLDSWVRTVSALMEDYYNNTLTTYIAGRGIVLNETGGVIFSTNIPELDKVRPNIFQIIIETPERDSQTFTHAGQDEYVWQTMWGTQMTRVFNLAGATVGLGGETVGALIGFIIYALAALLAFRPGHAIGAIAIPVPILIIVWGTGLSELALMAILLAVASLLLVWQFWWKGG